MNTIFYHHLVATPGVCGGKVRIKGTRIGVHDMIACFLLGWNFKEVMEQFPEITRAQLYECLAYYEDHREEIGALAAEQLPSHYAGHKTAGEKAVMERLLPSLVAA